MEEKGYVEEKRVLILFLRGKSVLIVSKEKQENQVKKLE
jgi:murein L,D-transpeptidase YafK